MKIFLFLFLASSILTGLAFICIVYHTQKVFIPALKEIGNKIIKLFNTGG